MMAEILATPLGRPHMELIIGRSQAPVAERHRAPASKQETTVPHPRKALHALLDCTHRVRPQLYAPTAQNDNDHPSSPAAAIALRPHHPRVTAAAIGTIESGLQPRWA